MTGALLFSVYLQRHLLRNSMTAAELAHQLGYKTLIPVERWLRGETLPPSSALLGLALALTADPVEVAVGWLIAECPELTDVLQDEVLVPLGCDFPRP